MTSTCVQHESRAQHVKTCNAQSLQQPPPLLPPSTARCRSQKRCPDVTHWRPTAVGESFPFICRIRTSATSLYSLLRFKQLRSLTICYTGTPQSIAEGPFPLKLFLSLLSQCTSISTQPLPHLTHLSIHATTPDAMSAERYFTNTARHKADFDMLTPLTTLQSLACMQLEGLSIPLITFSHCCRCRICKQYAVTGWWVSRMLEGAGGPLHRVRVQESNKAECSCCRWCHGFF